MSKVDFVDGRSKRALDQRKKTKEKILRAAQQVIGKKGFQSTSVEDVLKASDISRGTFYLYFESREVLFHELIDGFTDELKNRVQPIQMTNLKPVKQLQDNLVRIIEFMFENRDLSILLLKEAVGNTHIEGVDQKLRQLYEFLYKRASGAINNGVKLGLTRKVNEQILSIAVIGSIKEVVYHYLTSTEKNRPSAEAMAKELVDCFIKGLVRF